MTISKINAINLVHGATLYHTVEKDSAGEPRKCRVNGRCRTWKRDPDRWELPVKYGLDTCFYIGPHNAELWSVERPREPQLVASFTRQAADMGCSRKSQKRRELQLTYIKAALDVACMLGRIPEHEVRKVEFMCVTGRLDEALAVIERNITVE